MNAHLGDVQTPCLVLDRSKVKSNIERLRGRLAPWKVKFRPHLKTSKSLPIARLMMTDAQGPATVSTLEEAEHFGENGVRDLLYAVGLSEAKLDRVVMLRRNGTDLSVVLDDIKVARSVVEACRRSKDSIPVLIEVDCGDHRGGVDIRDSELLVEIGQTLVSGGANLRGVMVHAGNAYRCRTVYEIERVAEQERQMALEGAERLRAAGLSCSVVSVGSTPTALFGTNFGGLTEVRAGVFAFLDLTMAELGVCEESQIALSVLSTVIGTQPRHGRVIVDAGWMALSLDRGLRETQGRAEYGVACEIHGIPYPDLVLTELNQEHGILELRQGSTVMLPPLVDGDRVRILPNHACATAAQHDRYNVVSGTDREIQDVWPRIRGW